MTRAIPDDVEQWTAKQRQELVLQLLRTETTAAEAAQKYGLTMHEIEKWLDKALAAMENALSSSPQDEAEQGYLRDPAMIGLIYGDSFHYARNYLGLAKARAADIIQGYYDSDPEQIKFCAGKIIDYINICLGVLEQLQVEGLQRADNVIVDLHDLLGQVIGSKRIPLTIRIEMIFRATDPRINAPPKQLQQVFLVLLQNALDAAIGPGHTDGTIRISTDEHGRGEPQTIKVSISNTGRAIPPALREDLFSFPKASRSISRARGLGLGLTWVYWFLHFYGGKITYETSDDTGTTFHLYLPRVFKAKPE